MRITKEEFVSKHGHVKVEFSHYDKFVFHYTGETDDGLPVLIAVGGNSDAIYYMSVSASSEETISSLDPFGGETRNGERVGDVFYDY